MGNMTQEIFNQFVNEAKRLTEQDSTNDFETILNELIEEFEEEDED